jgi:hypothetical protein
LYKELDLQKKKNKKSVRLNLYSEPNKNIIDYYSPAQVVKTKEYYKKVIKGSSRRGEEKI